MLFEVLQGLQHLFGDAWSATISDVDLTGGNLSVSANNAQDQDIVELHRRFGQLGDPHGRFAQAKAHGVKMLQMIRDELDPDRLMNPHAWTTDL